MKYCKNCEKKVATKTKPVNHILHLLLSIVTAGVWLLVWLLICMNPKEVCIHCEKADFGMSTAGQLIVVLVWIIIIWMVVRATW